MPIVSRELKHVRPQSDGSGFLRKVAAYIAGFTATQIASALGIAETEAQVISDRAVHIRDTIDAALATDAGRVQEGLG